MNKKVIAKEWLVLLFSFVLGILIPPAILTLLFTGGFKKLGFFYEALFDKDKGDFLIAWLIVFSPYCVIQIIRGTYWSIKQMKQQ